jgi:hypothetical protein
MDNIDFKSEIINAVGKKPYIAQYLISDISPSQIIDTFVNIYSANGVINAGDLKLLDNNIEQMLYGSPPEGAIEKEIAKLSPELQTAFKNYTKEIQQLGVQFERQTGIKCSNRLVLYDDGYTSADTLFPLPTGSQRSDMDNYIGFKTRDFFADIAETSNKPDLATRISSWGQHSKPNDDALQQYKDTYERVSDIFNINIAQNYEYPFIPFPTFGDYDNKIDGQPDADILRIDTLHRLTEMFLTCPEKLDLLPDSIDINYKNNVFGATAKAHNKQINIEDIVDLQHEVTHILDQSDRGSLWGDGLLVGMNNADRAIIKDEFQRMKAIYKEHGEDDVCPLTDYSFGSDGVYFGAVKGKKEFTAQFVETFFISDKEVQSDLKSLSPPMYDVMSRYFNYRPFTSGTIGG